MSVGVMKDHNLKLRNLRASHTLKLVMRQDLDFIMNQERFYLFIMKDTNLKNAFRLSTVRKLFTTENYREGSEKEFFQRSFDAFFSYTRWFHRKKEKMRHPKETVFENCCIEVGIAWTRMIP